MKNRIIIFVTFCFLIIGLVSCAKKEEPPKKTKIIAGVLTEVRYYNNAYGAILVFDDGRTVNMHIVNGKVFQIGKTNIIYYHPSHWTKNHLDYVKIK